MKGFYTQARGARGRTAIRVIVIALVAILFASLQVTLFAEILFFGKSPDLILIFVLCISYFLGRYAGAITGIGAGFLIEAMGGMGITLLPLFYLFLGYLVGYFSRTVNPKIFTTYLIYLAVTLVYHAAITLTNVVMTYQSFHLGRVLLYLLLPEAASTALFGMLLYYPIKWMCKKLEKLR